MDVDKRASLEYTVMNPLVNEGMEPEYVWSLMSELVLTFPNYEEFKDGARVICAELLGDIKVSSITFRSKRMDCWIIFKK